MSRNRGSAPPPSPRRCPQARLPTPRGLRDPACLRSSFLQHERADVVDLAPPTRPDGAGRLFELHYRGAFDLRPRSHPLAVENGNLYPLAPEVRLPATALGVAFGRGLGQLGFVDGDRGDQTQVHELDRLVVHPVAVALLV